MGQLRYLAQNAKSRPNELGGRGAMKGVSHCFNVLQPLWQVSHQPQPRTGDLRASSSSSALCDDCPLAPTLPAVWMPWLPCFA